MKTSRVSAVVLRISPTQLAPPGRLRVKVANPDPAIAMMNGLPPWKSS
jgi:hypothetical protein